MACIPVRKPTVAGSTSLLAARTGWVACCDYHLRLRGIHVQEGFPCFLTTEHGDAEIDQAVAAFAASLSELQAAGILSRSGADLPAAAGGPPTPDAVALTQEQTEIRLAAQAGDEASCAFNESVTLTLEGPLDYAALQSAWDAIVSRHDALRASFGTTGEAMYLAGPRGLAFERSDVSAMPAPDCDAAVSAIVDREARTPFDLAGGPLVRGHLVRTAADKHAFVFTAHHIVCDGWLMNVVLSAELAELYRANAERRPASLGQALSFATYARRQTVRDPARVAADEAYWLARFQQAPPLLELPTDRPRPALKTYEGSTRTVRIDSDAYRAIKQSGARHGCTLFVTLLAAYDMLVARLADQSDIVVGVPAAGQALLDGEVLVGHCVDFLPVRVDVRGSASVADCLLEVKRRVLDAYEHQQVTLGTIVRKLGMRRENNRVPLAEIQFNLERIADGLDFGRPSRASSRTRNGSLTSTSFSTSSSPPTVCGSIATIMRVCSTPRRLIVGWATTRRFSPRSVAMRRRRLTPSNCCRKTSGRS